MKKKYPILVNIYLGDLEGIKEYTETKLKISEEYKSTYKHPIKYATIEQIMLWEFLIFTLLINPVLSIKFKNELKNIFRYDSKSNNKIFINNIKDDYKNELKNIPENILNKIEFLWYKFIASKNKDLEINIIDEINNIINIYKPSKYKKSKGISFQYKK